MAEKVGMFMVCQTIGSIPCCKCGVLMRPNATNTCLKCFSSKVNNGGLQKLVVIHCPECDSYLQPPKKWIKAQLESNELLVFCAKRWQDLNKQRLINCKFIWTEPHSKRIKLMLRVQEEVQGGVFLEKDYTVEYIVQDKMCPSCSRYQANPDQWVAVVQLRQDVSHRRTFFCLEQLILRHDAAARATRICENGNGVDFFFDSSSYAKTFVEFLRKVAVIRRNQGKGKLVSHCTKSNDSNFKHTFSIEICPICREDLICLSPKVSNKMGNIGPFVICTKVTNRIALLDPFTLRCHFLDADGYWKADFKSLLSSKQLVEYIVLDMEIVSSKVITGGSRYVLADAQVARVSDFGKNDRIFFVRTHLGHLLNTGDYALGYDLYGANISDMELDKYKYFVLPDAILIKKIYKEEKCQRKPRACKHKRLNMEVGRTTTLVEDEMITSEYEQFLRDLEEEFGDLDLADAQEELGDFMEE